MQSPAEEIAQVIKLLCSSASPDIQKATVEKYFCPDAEFRHPLCHVPPGIKSREEILGIYQWYRIMSPKLSIEVHSVMYDERQGRLITDSTQLFHIRWNPFRPASARLMTHIKLREVDGLHYIALQEDWYHPDDFMNLLVPPLTPLIRLGMRIGSIGSNINATLFQVLLGWWRPGSGQIVHDVKEIGKPAGRDD
ncbi:hypothetical protein GLOTRDRAFT_111915 [Gloeophyllum trabeum ATCC 11539]|uniref:SigF-like NTF2-like domain-containing protein n=1 Tax=Gloeophyllum trabeum (strain ATCC 11539 / FP-39264 / Madison 617) TaxID=670483 RepID=S7RKR2_GLOTA|nr:uncharacterized protein GLOTRDRAFT_111915 [Gloeophyllum trabeum ATCC 11539]EPQ53259.1 hypothetical protein GLOTRDRAFT_111915 [Gloeophyllum trabeum ATCC 11539]